MNSKVFNNIIADYAFARPGYPITLFEDILDLQSFLKEHGSGNRCRPGQATDCFVKHGYSVTSLEIGEDQVKFLQEKYASFSNFQAVYSSFEEYDVSEDSFDLVFSATAFHWTDPGFGIPKAYRLLKKGGTLALFWHLESVVSQETEHQKELSRVFQRYAPELDDYISPIEGEKLHLKRAAQMGTDGLFGPVETKTYRWVEEYAAERYIRLLNSYSDMHEISEDKRKVIFDDVAAYFAL